MARSRCDGAHRENAFSLTLPKECTVEFRFAHKRAWLITDVDQAAGNHRHGKGDCDRVALGDFSARWFDYHAACIRLGLGGFFFLVILRKCSNGKRNNQRTDKEQRETAKCGSGLTAATRRRAKRALIFKRSPFHLFCRVSS